MHHERRAQGRARASYSSWLSISWDSLANAEAVVFKPWILRVEHILLGTSFTAFSSATLAQLLQERIAVELRHRYF